MNTRCASTNFQEVQKPLPDIDYIVKEDVKVMSESDQGKQTPVPTELFHNLSTAQDLFEKAKTEYQRFVKKPNDCQLFNLLCTVNHLKEWIAAESLYPWTEEFCQQLNDDEDYKRVKELCNGIKHYKRDPKRNKNAPRPSKSEGFYAGISRAGDSLNQKNYFVEEQDIRDVLSHVLKKYEDFFKSADDSM